MNILSWYKNQGQNIKIWSSYPKEDLVCRAIPYELITEWSHSLEMLLSNKKEIWTSNNFLTRRIGILLSRRRLEMDLVKEWGNFFSSNFPPTLMTETDEAQVQCQHKHRFEKEKGEQELTLPMSVSHNTPGKGFDNILHLFKEVTCVKPHILSIEPIHRPYRAGRTYLPMVPTGSSQGVIWPWSHPGEPAQ